MRDAFPKKALKHNRVLAISGADIDVVNEFRQSLSLKTERNPNPINMYFYSEQRRSKYVNAALAIPLISLSEFTRPSKIVFGVGTFYIEGFNELLQWMVDNRDKGYFKNLEYLQVTGHRIAISETQYDMTEIVNTIVSNLQTMCTDKVNFPKLNTTNFNNNDYNKQKNDFANKLRGACDSESGVTVLARQVDVTYDTMCSTENSNNLEYYDMTDPKEVEQCRYTWNWENGYESNVYAPSGPYPNGNTPEC